MTALRIWLLGVIATALLLSVVSGLFPKGKYRAVGSFVGGLTMLIVMVRPLLGLDIASWSEIEAALAWRNVMTVEEQGEELAAVISDKTAAYIQHKASSLDLTCRAEVRCTSQEGVPFPTEVWLDIAYHEQLSQLIATDLAIDTAHQYWQKEAP